MSSAFVAPGTNAAQGQQQQQHDAAQMNLSLLSSLSPYLQNQISFQKSQLPYAENAIQGLGQFTTQSGRNQLTNAFAQSARGQAQTAASQTPGQYTGNAALANAYALSAYNGANQASNQYAQQIDSPQGESAAFGSYLQGLQSESPNFSGVGTLTGGVNSQPTVQVGQGLMGYLSQAAGDVAQFYKGR